MESFKEKKRGHEVVRGVSGIPAAGLGASAPPCHLLCFLLPTPFVAGVGCVQVRSVLGWVGAGRWAGEKTFALSPALSGATGTKYLTLGY